MNSTSTLRYLSILLFVLLSSALQAQQLYYVVIGSFGDEGNAQKFAGYVRNNLYDAVCDRHSEKSMFYVYVLKTSDKAQATHQAKQLQAESEFKDTWVFNGMLDKDLNRPAEPVTVAKEEIEEPEHVVVDTTAQTPAPAVVSEEIKPDTAAVAANVVPETMPTIPVFDPKMVVRGKLIRFVIEAPDGRIIPGNVHHVDYEQGRDIATFKSGQYLDILPPPTVNNPMTIVCAIFGYKEVVQVVDYNKPGGTIGVVHDENGAWVIPYKLEPLNTGDVSVMYRVSFYKDAVIMLPIAKAELDQLVYMMTSNPNYKIKIHGHCNGNNSRRIIAIGAEQNFFDMKGSNEVKGSAKELSKMRAEAVQTYLVNNGIDISRTEIYAWGGLNMLVGENSTSAKLNDRIEIEILGD